MTFTAEIYPAGKIEDAVIATYNLGYKGKMDAKNIPHDFLDQILVFDMVESFPVGFSPMASQDSYPIILNISAFSWKKKGIA